MTTGSKADGLIIFESLIGANTYRNYVTKSWSGGDSTIKRPPREVIDTSFEESFIRVRKGKKYVVIKYRKRFTRLPTRLPKRAVNSEEHPYNVDIRRTSTFMGQKNFIGFDQWQYTDFSGYGLGNPSSLPLWSSNDDLNLIGKLREKVAGSDFNAAVFLAEGHEALDMIRNTATKLYWGYRAAKQGDFRSARRYLVQGTDRARLGRKVAANNWLELQYGWLPLLKDIEGGAQFLAHHLNFPMQKVYKVQSKRVPGQLSTTSPSLGDFHSKECYSRGQIKAILKESDVVALSGLQDPLSVAWEKLPYSFVADWFIPIGNYLSARGLASALTGTFVSTNTFRHKVTDGYAVPGSGLEFTAEAKRIYFEKIIINRSVSNSLSVPLPSFKPLGKVASWQHCANAVALLVGLSKA